MARVGIAKEVLNNGRACGDACGYWQLDDKILLCVVDGLGHGRHAAAAANAALDCIAKNPGEPLGSMFEKCNAALSGTRGAAMSLAVVDEVTGALDYAGVGNVNVAIGRAGATRLPNAEGIVGTGLRSLAIETIRLSPRDLIVMYTDGVKTRIDFRGYDQAVVADPQRFAERLLHDWRRGTDDAAILVYRYEGG